MDEVIKIILYVFGNILINVFYIYFIYNLLDKKFKLFEKNNIMMTLTLTIIGLLLNSFFPRAIKFILTFIIMLVVIYYIADKKLYKSLLIFILLEINAAICEMIFSFIINLIMNDDNIILMNILCNYFIIALGTLIVKSKIPRICYIKILNSMKAIKKNEIIIYSLIIILIIIFSTIESYVNLPISIVIITNTSMAIFFISIIAKLITTKNKYQTISDKYQTSISSLKEYESMIDRYRVNNHENKNELMTIRNMIKTKDKKIIDYIDKLVNNKTKDNEIILSKTSKIPEGGLRAIIYSKLNLMDKFKIKYDLEIANDVKTTDLINLSDELIINICKILGVFFDNAIDAVRKIKNKRITIEIYTIDNYLNIDITNTFKDNIDISKLGNQKFTTKGTGHGYGLSLVNKIIEENNNILKNEKRINRNNFTQSLKIKL